MASKMVERVALAIREERMLNEQYVGHNGERWPRPPIDEFYGVARAAIEAMRQITPEMLQTGQGWDGIPAIWGRMIDAALGNEQP